MADMDLKAFLKENVIEKAPVLYVASKRMVANGEPVEWHLRCLSNEEMEKLTQRNTKREPIKGTRDFKEKFDNVQFAMDMVVASVQYPPLANPELQESYGVVGEEDLLKAMLTPGELTDLQGAVAEACDYEAGMADKIKQAKN